MLTRYLPIIKKTAVEGLPTNESELFFWLVSRKQPLLNLELAQSTNFHESILGLALKSLELFLTTNGWPRFDSSNTHMTSWIILFAGLVACTDKLDLWWQILESKLPISDFLEIHIVCIDMQLGVLLTYSVEQKRINERCDRIIAIIMQLPSAEKQQILTRLKEFPHLCGSDSFICYLQSISDNANDISNLLSYYQMNLEFEKKQTLRGKWRQIITDKILENVKQHIFSSDVNDAVKINLLITLTNLWTANRCLPSDELGTGFLEEMNNKILSTSIHEDESKFYIQAIDALMKPARYDWFDFVTRDIKHLLLKCLAAAALSLENGNEYQLYLHPARKLMIYFPTIFTEMRTEQIFDYSKWLEGVVANFSSESFQMRICTANFLLALVNSHPFWVNPIITEIKKQLKTNNMLIPELVSFSNQFKASDNCLEQLTDSDLTLLTDGARKNNFEVPIRSVNQIVNPILNEADDPIKHSAMICFIKSRISPCKLSSTQEDQVFTILSVAAKETKAEVANDGIAAIKNINWSSSYQILVFDLLRSLLIACQPEIGSNLINALVSIQWPHEHVFDIVRGVYEVIKSCEQVKNFRISDKFQQQFSNAIARHCLPQTLNFVKTKLAGSTLDKKLILKLLTFISFPPDISSEIFSLVASLRYEETAIILSKLVWFPDQLPDFVKYVTSLVSEGCVLSNDLLRTVNLAVFSDPLQEEILNNFSHLLDMNITEDGSLNDETALLKVYSSGFTLLGKINWNEKFLPKILAFYKDIPRKIKSFSGAAYCDYFTSIGNIQWLPFQIDELFDFLVAQVKTSQVYFALHALALIDWPEKDFDELINIFTIAINQYFGACGKLMSYVAWREQDLPKILDLYKKMITSKMLNEVDHAGALEGLSSIKWTEVIFPEIFALIKSQSLQPFAMIATLKKITWPPKIVPAVLKLIGESPATPILTSLFCGLREYQKVRILTFSYDSDLTLIKNEYCNTRLSRNRRAIATQLFHDSLAKKPIASSVVIMHNRAAQLDERITLACVLLRAGLHVGTYINDLKQAIYLQADFRLKLPCKLVVEIATQLTKLNLVQEDDSLQFSLLKICTNYLITPQGAVLSEVEKILFLEIFESINLPQEEYLSFLVRILLYTPEEHGTLLGRVMSNFYEKAIAGELQLQSNDKDIFQLGIRAFKKIKEIAAKCEEFSVAKELVEILAKTEPLVLDFSTENSCTPSL